MKFGGPLLAVKDIEASKKFYIEVLKQKIVFDIGPHVGFEGMFSLQEGYAELVGFDKNEMLQCPKNFQLYFEEEDLDSFIEHLGKYADIKYLHHVKEYSWGQRVVRFFDPDMHIIEVAESMEIVVKRFLKQGLSVEETAERTMFPIDFVKSCI
ncbi:Catechol 2,3-dioxygenase [Natronincola peptidivorans]|uniref:Catechol 2,3-dioxygenase n=1 Tax=Natronincola peptidivorans TaxID=426128 RepID=A0A1I0FSG3_9FIRM|nr:VOC family protein [Natronincola peptidivorans]SET61361.1 Catechol 2,3-dioxygenase [Natronincola peptidivorans]